MQDIEPTSVESLKEEGERAGLQGRHSDALSCFQHALILAIQEGNDWETLNIIALIAIVYKQCYHALPYGDSKRPSFIELMGAFALAGVRISDARKIKGQPRSVVLLRTGDYYYALADFEKAALMHRQSIEELRNYARFDRRLLYSEYLGHLGQALGMLGDTGGLPTLTKSLTIARDLHRHEVRPFHKLVLISGLLLKFGELYLHSGQTEDARKVTEDARNHPRRAGIREAQGLDLPAAQAGAFHGLRRRNAESRFRKYRLRCSVLGVPQMGDLHRHGKSVQCSAPSPDAICNAGHRNSNIFSSFSRRCRTDGPRSLRWQGHGESTEESGT